MEKAESITVLSALAIDEILFALLKIHGIADYGQNFWFRTLKDDKDILKSYLPIMKQAISALESLPYLLCIDITYEQVLAGIEAIESYGLFPRDAIHISSAHLSDVMNILTINRDYVKVATDFDVYTCNPKLLAER